MNRLTSFRPGRAFKYPWGERSEGRMPWRSLHPRTLPTTWRYALVGGLASIPLTLLEYWRAGMGNHMSLDMVAVGGLLAGYLAAGRVDDVGRVGLRAGLVGAVPGLWLSARMLEFALTRMDPPWFRLVGIVVTILLTAFVFFASGVVGYLAGKVGGWLAGKTGRRPTAPAGG